MTRIWTSEGEVIIEITDKNFASSDEVDAAMQDSLTEEEFRCMADCVDEGTIVSSKEDVQSFVDCGQFESMTWKQYIDGCKKWAKDMLQEVA